jgi:hypothetical protein
MKISKEQICAATEWWCWKLRRQTYISLSEKQIAPFKKRIGKRSKSGRTVNI